MREERERGRILLIVRGGKVQKSRKREIAARNLPGTLLVLFLFFWYSHLHSTLDSLAVFEKLFLLIGVDIEGHLFTLLNRNFLQACSVMIVFLISRFFLQIAETEIYG